MHIKKYLLAGLLLWMPLAITVWLLTWLYGIINAVFTALLDTMAAVLSPDIAPGIVALQHYKGLGVLLMFVLLLLSGAFASNVTGRWWVKQWHKLFTYIPVVKSIYTSVKKISGTLFSNDGNAFRKAVLVPFPGSDCWTIAFLTGAPSGEVAARLDQDYVSVYVPTTPNPTSGYFILVPKSQMRELGLSVDQALTYIISMGAVMPEDQAKAKATAKALGNPDQHSK